MTASPDHEDVVRWTPQRAAVLEVVRTARDHPTAREVYERVRETQPGIGVATVYRALDLLVSFGQVRALTLDGEATTRYDANTSDHHHVRCTRCGQLSDVALPVAGELLGAAEARSGFAVDAAEVLFRGRCPACQATS